MSEFPETPYGLHPAEDLFYPLALPLADPIALMPCGSAIDSAMLLLRHVRRSVEPAEILYEAFGVIAFVRSHRYPVFPWGVTRSLPRRPLRGAVGLHRFHIRHQSVAIIHQHVTGVTQFRFFTPALPASNASGSVVD